MPQYILLGPIKVYFYGIFISLAIIFWYLYLKSSLKGTKEHSCLDRVLTISLLSALFGARLYHVLSWYSYYLAFPEEIIYFWNGGLGIFGAIFGGLAGIYFYSKLKKIDYFKLISSISPSLLIVQSIGRLGNYFNYEAFGPPTNLPWRIFIPISERPLNYLGESYFHPTFLYESILCLIAFLIYLFIFKKNKPPKSGFAYYLISYGLIRFFTEFFRIDTLVIYNIHAAHIFSLVMIISGLMLLNQSFKPPRRHLGGTVLRQIVHKLYWVKSHIEDLRFPNHTKFLVRFVENINEFGKWKPFR